MNDSKLGAVLATLLAVVALLIVALSFGLPAPAHAQTGGHNGYKYISAAGTTAVRTGSGYLDIVSINGGSAGVITLYDIDYAGCTGTPASGKFATIQAISTTNPTSMFYDTAVKNGICVVTAANTDVTVIFD